MELDIEHRMAAHCENGVISNMLRFYGIELSEPMILGLSSGLFFSHMPFVKLSGMAVTSFRTFPGVFFSRITKLLGIKSSKRRFLSKKRAMQALDDVLKSGHPAGCIVGMYYLSYMPKAYRFHFNGHNILVIGYDEHTDEYIVSDPTSTKKERISSEEMIKVRFAKGGTYPLYGAMYRIKEVPKQLPDLKPLIIDAILKNCRIMNHRNYIYFCGVPGIHYLAKRLRRWSTDMTEREAALNLAQIIRMLEEIGTGGAGFRFMYGAFLQESAKITNIPELNDYAMRMSKIGDKWRYFVYRASRMLRKHKSETCTFDDLADMVEEIANDEDKLYTDLYATGKSYRKR